MRRVSESEHVKKIYRDNREFSFSEFHMHLNQKNDRLAIKSVENKLNIDLYKQEQVKCKFQLCDR